jgi:hypothetical protein
VPQQERKMDTGLAEPGVGISAFLLSLGLFFTLTEKGLLSSNDARNIVDLALRNLESDGETGKALPEEMAVSARHILQSIRVQL